ncbi:unnamed protein product [Tetraodon nigroviridis]|uniref:Growth/differentiation factor 8 n=1 Tax=Tetraodon nigroviridis TaxID=99883 RepID=Q4RTJ4_TETNG|nr:unnamed protein product [Tetraodon nigroviridis]
MRLCAGLPYLSLVISLTLVVLSGQETHQQPPASGAEDTEQCVTCHVRQHIRSLRLNAIKSQILSKLRMKEAPNISRDTVQQLLPKAPPLQQLLDQYDVLGDDNRDVAAEEDDEHATTETIMVMAAEPASVVQVNAQPKCCFFAFTQKFQASRLVRAQLWVHLRAATEATTVFLQISRLMPATDGSRHIRIRSLKLDVKAGLSSWQSIDVKQVLSVWLRQPETNWGIEINAFDSRGRDLAVTSAQPGDEGLGAEQLWPVSRRLNRPGFTAEPDVGQHLDPDSSQNLGADGWMTKTCTQPFMEVKISEGPRRLRRDLGLDCDENSPESRCCRYPLTVDFEDFGWDWIIAPKRYKANYCSGECEYMHLQKYPHTHLVNKANPRGTAGPCCTPTKMSPINMLYFNQEEQIIYGKIPSPWWWTAVDVSRRGGRGPRAPPGLRLLAGPPLPALLLPPAATRCNRTRVEASERSDRAAGRRLRRCRSSHCLHTPNTHTHTRALTHVFLSLVSTSTVGQSEARNARDR